MAGFSLRLYLLVDGKTGKVTVMHNEIKSRLGLDRLIYLLSGMAITAHLVSNCLHSLVARQPRALGFVYPARTLSAFLIVAVAAGLCGRIKSLLVWRLNARGSLENVALGLVTGTAVAIFAGWAQNSDLPYQYALLSDPLSPVGITTILLLMLGLPVVGELFFRGIVFGSLLEHTTVPAAIIGSSIVYACFWPLYGPSVCLVFALLTAGLFYRARSLIAPIVASAVLNCLLLVATLYHLP
jgi:membrane protease YdiL (CAAX protease family)